RSREPARPLWRPAQVAGPASARLRPAPGLRAGAGPSPGRPRPHGAPPMFASLFRRPAGGHGRPCPDRRAADPNRFVPAVTDLEGRDVPSGAPTLPFRESLTPVRVAPPGAAVYEGHATPPGPPT